MTSSPLCRINLDTNFFLGKKKVSTKYESNGIQEMKVKEMKKTFRNEHMRCDTRHKRQHMSILRIPI